MQLQIVDIHRPIEVPQQGLLCDILWSDPDKVSSVVHFLVGSQLEKWVALEACLCQTLQSKEELA